MDGICLYLLCITYNVYMLACCCTETPASLHGNACERAPGGGGDGGGGTPNEHVAVVYAFAAGKICLCCPQVQNDAHERVSHDRGHLAP